MTKAINFILNVIAILLILFYLISFLIFLSGCPGSTSSSNVPTESWKNHPEWSAHLQKKVDQYWPDLSKAKDIERLCPNYSKLDEAKKKAVFSEMFIAVMFFESAWNPLSRYQESTMGKDPVTGKPVYSEGLFQMSYQDEPWAKCGFDWSLDNYLDDIDPKKTILDPFINMSCGVKVMARQIKLKNKIILAKGEGAYWAVILDGGRYQRIDEIAKMVKRNVKECEEL